MVAVGMMDKAKEAATKAAEVSKKARDAQLERRAQRDRHGNRPVGLMDKAKEAATKAKEAATKAAEVSKEARDAQLERRAEREATIAALQKWDYKVIYIREGRQSGAVGSGGFESELRDNGKHGWEMCGHIGDRVILKRPLVS